jgi:hypothetical protein
MSVSFQEVSDEGLIRACQQIQVDVFHEELRLYGMQIPDEHDDASIHVAMIERGVIVGTFRVVLPNDSHGLPIREVWLGFEAFSWEPVCEMSRLAIPKSHRGQGLLGSAVSFVGGIAKKHNLSAVVADVLLENREAFEDEGFECIGSPFCDASVDTLRTGSVNCVPMMRLSPPINGTRAMESGVAGK